MSQPEVICEKQGAAGLIRLNRPQALNALTLGMVREMSRALDAWERDPDVACVVVTGEGGKAFSAGGDIRLLHDQGKAGDHAAQIDFWREEYILNRRIKLYPKPYVALIDGIVMGGGAGVSINGSHRIAGDRFAFAMPEVGIGFFPDIGATWFLPRLPGKTGLYLGLTGARARAGDAVALGLAEAYVPSAQFEALRAALIAGESVEAAVKRLCAPAPASAILAERAAIDAGLSGENVAECLTRLDADASPFAVETARTIRAKSPTSLAIAFRQMQIGGGLDIDDAMRVEFRIVSRLCRGHDFYEGVRAVIIDKDNAPRWSPARVADVSDAAVDAYFAPLGAGEELTFSGGGA
jgi:enoyl-CoA hydratase